VRHPRHTLPTGKKRSFFFSHKNTRKKAKNPDLYITLQKNRTSSQTYSPSFLVAPRTFEVYTCLHFVKFPLEEAPLY